MQKQISCAELVPDLYRWGRQLVVSCTCVDMVRRKPNVHQLVVISWQMNISIMENKVLDTSCSGSLWSSISSSSTESLSSTTEEFWNKYERGYKTRSFWKKVRRVLSPFKKIELEHNKGPESLDEFFDSLKRHFLNSFKWRIWNYIQGGSLSSTLAKKNEWDEATG